MSIFKKVPAFFILLLFFISCNSSSTKTETKNTEIKSDKTHLEGYLIQPDFIKKECQTNHSKLIGIKGNVASFNLYLKTLDTSIVSIPLALDYIKTCIPLNDTISGDSAFLYFRDEFYSIINKLGDSIFSEYSSIVLKINMDSVNTPDIIAFKNNFDQCGVGIFSTEGDNYLDQQPNYFYDNFKNRVTTATKEFLKLRKTELSEGYSEDAGLLISFESLYQRVRNWEKFNTLYPHSICSNEGKNFYNSYLETLLTGMDNSRVFDMETNTLTPEVKKLYIQIIKDTADSKTSKIISAYYDLLSKQNFVENDSIIHGFLVEHNLETMVGVEPHTR